MIVHYPWKRLSTILQPGLLPGNCFFNVQKCCVLSTNVGLINKRTSHSGSNKYYLNGVFLTNNVIVLDLGITISADLSYNAHVNNIVAIERYSDRLLYFVVLLHAIFNSCVKLLSLKLDLYLRILVSCGVQT